MEYLRYKEAVDYICSTPLFAKKAGFDNLRELLGLVGNPQNRLEFIHVAGTNGKGSVSTMLASIYKQANYKVGVFTSPHLIKINERIKVDDRDITDEDFVSIYLYLMDNIHHHIKIGGKHPTFFEMLFIMGLIYFEKKKVDFVILEAGIGGQKDTTNVIPKKIISVITSVGLDHTDLLGDTIEAVAKEKAGIIEKNGRVVIHTQHQDAIRCIEAIAKERQATVYHGEAFNYTIEKRLPTGLAFSINSKYYNYDKLFLNSYAHYQIYNVATALLVVKLIEKQYPIEEKNVVEGIKNFSWAGRMEQINDQLLLEGAHNKEGLEHFINTIDRYYSDRKITLVFSMVRGKDYEEVINRIVQLNNLEKIIIYDGIDRSIDGNLLKEAILRKHISCELNNDLVSIVKETKKNSAKELTCCIGSLYLVGAIKKILLGGAYD